MFTTREKLAAIGRVARFRATRALCKLASLVSEKLRLPRSR